MLLGTTTTLPREIGQERDGVFAKAVTMPALRLLVPINRTVGARVQYSESDGAFACRGKRKSENGLFGDDIAPKLVRRKDRTSGFLVNR